MNHSRLYLLFITLLLASLISINTNTGSVNQTIAPLQMIYKATLLQSTTVPEVGYSYRIYVIHDLNGDGVNEIYLIPHLQEWKTCFIDGASFTKWSCIQSPEGEVNSITPVGDNNGDGVNELVLITIKVDSIESTTNISVYYIDPINGYIELKNSTKINETLIMFITLFPFQNTLFENNVISTTFVYLRLRGWSIEEIGSFIIQYDFETNSLDYRKYENRAYDIFTNNVFGDLDNDGVLDLTNEYKVVSYIDVDLFFGVHIVKYSYLSVYRGYELLFEKNSTDSAHLSLLVVYNNERYLFISIEQNITDLTTTQHIIRGYDEEGEQVFETKLPPGLMLHSVVPVGDRLLVLSMESESPTHGPLYIDLVSSINGEILDSMKLDNITLPTVFSTGLGDIDEDTFKEVLLIYWDTDYNFYTRVLRISDSIINVKLVGLGPGTYPVVNMYEVNNLNYLVAGFSENDNTVIKLYEFVSHIDSTEPVVSVISPKYGDVIGKLPYYVYGRAYDYESEIVDIKIYLLGEKGVRYDLVNVKYDKETQMFEAEIPEYVTSGVYDLIIEVTNEVELTKTVKLRIIIDLLPPEISISAPLKYDLVIDASKLVKIDNRANITLNINVTDNVKLRRIEVYVDNKTVFWKYPVDEQKLSMLLNVTLEEGIRILKVNATDIAYNTKSVDKKVVVDLTEPVIERFEINVVSATRDFVNLTISYRIKDNLSGIDYVEIVAGEVIRNISVNKLEDESTVNLFNVKYTGNNITVTLKAVDKAGWEVVKIRTATITPVVTPPETPPESPPAQTPETPSETPKPREEEFNWIPVIIGIVIVLLIIIAVIYLLRTRK